MPKGFQNIIGKQFGTLTVIAPTGEKGPHGCLILVRCDCGNERTLVRSELRKAKFCGLKCPLRPGPNRSHNLSNSPTYFTWKGMIQRCHNPKDPSYARYGALGIAVCERWKIFANFLADMGKRPEGTTLDRKDVNGNYEPENCRWATASEQQVNKRSTKRFQFQGESLTLSEWASRFGINPITLETRINRHGWTIERALTQPIKPRGARTWNPNA